MSHQLDTLRQLDTVRRRFATLRYRHVAMLACIVIQSLDMTGDMTGALAQIAYEPIHVGTAAENTMPGEVVIDGNHMHAASNASVQTSNPMLWRQYQALQSGSPSSDGCQSCGSGGTSDYDRCGCNPGLFHWIDGPGNCDNWCVGPRWGVEATGLFFFRENADFNLVTNSLAALEPTTTNQLMDQFEHGPGVRIFATKYNEAGYGFQVGYEGINEWTATATFAQDPADDPDITRTATYDSQYNSLEANFLARTSTPWEIYSGVRFVRIDEDFVNSPLRDAALVTSASDVLIDVGSSHILENNLIGFQLGSRRNAWNLWNRLSIEAFATGGVYCNKFKRRDSVSNTTTIIVADDPLTLDVNEFSQTSNVTTQTTSSQNVNEIAFLGEAGVSGVWQLNPCLALRGGYQILAVDNIGQGIDAFLNPGAGLPGTTLVYHGLQFGLEYRR